MAHPIYLDNQAATRVDPRVLDAMLPWLTELYGNAASRSHAYGLTASAAVNIARGQVADLIGAHPEEIIFTSGATESVNLAIKGAVEAAYQRSGGGSLHVVTAATEHRAVLDSCKRLERAGISVTVLPVDKKGRVSVKSLSAALQPDTVLASIMWANNEIGTIAPVAEIAALCNDQGVLFHSDATQAVGILPVDVSEIPVDLLSFSAHKMYGPQGAGALYVRHRVPAIQIAAQIDGGGHERGLRSGTLNVPAIVGFGKAAEICIAERATDAWRIGELRNALVAGLREALPGLKENGDVTNRLPHNASITFPGIQADRIMRAMPGLAVSSGAACSSAQPGPSHVLRALGLPAADASATIRFSPGRFTTDDDIASAVHIVAETIRTPHHDEQQDAHEGTRSHSHA
ncbi:MAG: cysteine desulfurase [Ignavibacteriae bacterium]|nr:cysteine desulfurase [Ignavibacteriota bacterium]